jgi:glycosyltransferase involved in cell wall biosynthesis
VLIPAHNEEAVLGLTLESLARQTRRPDRVIVVADNSTDRTVDVAAAHGVEVVETVGNTEKKAGALNQQLSRLLPQAGPHDVVLVMDADSTLAPEFLEVALGLMESDAGLIAVGGLFYGENGGALVGQFQRNEYTRYQRLVARRRGRVFVLTGTASVIRAYALRAVADARGPLLPGPAGRVYDTLALTEDNELTLALKTLGAKMTCPSQCRVTTEIMTSWRDLWRQRLRWQRGALENIAAYGLTRATVRYWGQQLGLAYGVVAFQSYLLLMTVGLLAADSLRWSPFWVAIGMIFVVERIVTSWAAGWRPSTRRADVPRARVRLVPPSMLRLLVRADPPRTQSRLELRAEASGFSSPDALAVRHRTPHHLGSPASRIGPDDRLVHRPGLLGRVQHPRLRVPQRPPPTAGDSSPTRPREWRGTGAARRAHRRLILARLRGVATDHVEALSGLTPRGDRPAEVPLDVHESGRLDDPDHERGIVQDEVQVDVMPEPLVEVADLGPGVHAEDQPPAGSQRSDQSRHRVGKL